MSVVRTRVAVGNQGLLGALEERALIHAAAAGDATAAEMLLVAHHGLVKSLARRYRSPHVAYEDLIAEGQVALLETIELFDESLGSRFASYARWRVRTRMRTLARSTKRGLDSPESGDWNLETEDRRHDEQVDLGPAARHGPPELIDWTEQPERKLALAELRWAMQKSLEHLRSRLSIAKQVVLRERILADEPLTLVQLATRLSISAERVRQIEMAVELELLRLIAGLDTAESGLTADLRSHHRGGGEKKAPPLEFEEAGGN